MNTRLLKAVRCMIQLCRRQSDDAREAPGKDPNSPNARQAGRKGLIGVAWSVARQGYHRPGDATASRSSAFVVTKRSQKTAAAAAYLSGLLGAPLPCLAPGRRTLALAAWLDAGEARANRLRYRPVRFLKTLRSITRGLDDFAAKQIILLLFSYWNYRMLLPRWQPAFFLCVSDLSPRRIAAACAAELTETPVLFFQDDWHHDTAPPFPVAAASVLNGTGLTAVRPSLRAGGIAASRGTAPSAPHIRACPTPPRRFGIALNNYFDQDDVLDLLRRMRGRFSDAAIVVRRHPRSQTPLRAHPDGVIDAPAGQPLADFAAGCDVVLVGNSAVQIGLLLAGAAVVHVGNLDQVKFDFYRYVSAGIVYGMPTFGDVAVDDINRFYADPDWRRRFLAKLAFGDVDESDVHPEGALRDWMTALLGSSGNKAPRAP